jgi:hypothetical protein
MKKIFFLKAALAAEAVVEVMMRPWALGMPKSHRLTQNPKGGEGGDEEQDEHKNNNTRTQPDTMNFTLVAR